jgi:lactoylglutathione lyase
MPLLFSYGTLQQEGVQKSTFGRLLRGQPDELVGFEQSLLKIEDPEFVATSGKAHHAIVRFNGKNDSRVAGTVLELSEGELASADRYEPSGYKRISTTLASGKQAWVYAAAPNVQQAVPFFNVTDIEASLHFYVDGLGCAMTMQWAPEGRVRWCWLQLGEAALMLQEYWRDGRPAGAPSGPLGQGVSVCFMCADAIAIYHEVTARGIAADRPYVGNGLWVTSVRDPDGYRLDFESPTDVPEGTEYTG